MTDKVFSDIMIQSGKHGDDKLDNFRFYARGLLQVAYIKIKGKMSNRFSKS